MEGFTLPQQYGQEVPFVRLLGVAFHSCPLSQSHHIFFLDPGNMCSAVNPLFFMGCNSFDKFGYLVDKQLSLQTSLSAQ
jgi:hypothetical protein